jgi:hypothetical protein
MSRLFAANKIRITIYYFFMENYGQLGADFIQPRERITFGENSSRGSGVVGIFEIRLPATEARYCFKS